MNRTLDLAASDRDSSSGDEDASPQPAFSWILKSHVRLPLVSPKAPPPSPVSVDYSSEEEEEALPLRTLFLLSNESNYSDHTKGQSLFQSKRPFDPAFFENPLRPIHSTSSMISSISIPTLSSDVSPGNDFETQSSSTSSSSNSRLAKDLTLYNHPLIFESQGEDNEGPSNRQLSEPPLATSNVPLVRK